MSGGRGYSNHRNNRNNGNGYRNNNNYNNGRGSRRNRFNNNGNNRNQNRNNNNNNNLPEEALPPMTYEAKPDKQTRIKVEWTHGRGANPRTESEKLAVYDDTAKEDYLRTLAEYREVLIDYPHLQNDANATTACRIFKRCLKGSAKNTCSRAVAAVNGGVIDTNGHLETVLQETTSVILGINAYDNQMEYLKTTKKPRKLSVDDWMRRIQNINLHMVNMEQGATLLDDRTLIKEIIIPNLPVGIKYQLKMQGGSALPWNRVKELLTNMFALTNWEHSKKNNQNGHSRGNGRRRQNHNNNTGNGRRNNGYNNHNNNGNDQNNNNRREETYQQRNTQENNTRTETNSYYSDDEGREESNMMRARLKCRSSKESDKKTKPQSCAIIVSVKTAAGRKNVLALADTGSSATLANKHIIKDCMSAKQEKAVEWSTQGGVFNTTHTSMISNLKLPQFTRNRSLAHEMHLFSKNKNDRYDFIFGRDLLHNIGIDILFSKKVIAWDGIEVEMLSREELRTNLDDDNELRTVEEICAVEPKVILDAQYEKPDLIEVANEQTQLTGVQKDSFLKFLLSKEAAFRGKRGDWNGEPVDFELKPGAKPFAMRPYMIPHALYKTTKKEVERLEKEVGLLSRNEDLHYLSSCFIIPKKDQTVRFITDFRKLNKMIVRKPYPLPNIQETLTTIGNFTYATVVDLVMGYYHMRLSEKAKRLCGIVLPWGTYNYNMLPMGLCIATDVFQARLGQLFADMENVLIYIDDILVVTHGSFNEHLSVLEEVFNRLIKKGMQVHPRKCDWFKEEVDYLGYVINKEGIRPQAKKIEKMLAIEAPKNASEVRSFLGMVNYYRYMWRQRSTLIAPLTEVSNKKGKSFVWTPRQQNAFDRIKKVIAKETMLVYPNFDVPFEVHTDASDYQLGGVVAQMGKPISYFSRKLNSAQKNYTTGEKELLGIAETLKEFRYILLGHRIIVYTDHKNLCRDNTIHERQRVMRQRLLIEEYGAEIKYIEGEKNVVADALSRLPYSTAEMMKFENYANEEMENVNDFDLFQLPKIAESQQKNVAEMRKYSKRTEPCGTELYVHRDKIVIPEELRTPLMRWYHDSLVHAAAGRMTATIRAHFYWLGMDRDIREYCSHCPDCQISKKTARRPVGHLPLRAPRSVTPWERVHVDGIGKWDFDVHIVLPKKTIKRSIQAITMICEASLWPEVARISCTKAWHVAKVFDHTWLCRYPRPKVVVFDNGKEFVGEEFQELLESYAIKAVPTTVKNPQANGVVERMHLTLADMLRTMTVIVDEECPIKINDAIDTMLQSAAWSLRTTISTVTNVSPGMAVFGRDMIFNFKMRVNGKEVEKKRDHVARRDNIRENSKRLPYKYTVGEKILIVNKSYERNRKLSVPTKGPFIIVQINKNGTVVIERNQYYETINIRRIRPFKEQYTKTNDE